MNKSVIIVAGGKGTRMGMETPKQFLPLNGLPILMHTVKRFFEYAPEINIIVVLPEKEINTWKNLLKEFNFSIPHSVAAGGSNRIESVKKGLNFLSGRCIVAIHDGVRPFCSPDLINRCFKEAEKTTNAIPAIPISETIRELQNDNSSVINRDNLRIIQTPQCFDSELLIKAYSNAGNKNYTDDASVFENDGNKIHLVEGEKTNIKITVPADLLIASAINKTIYP
jgi:2-C-methyl-D-erythritol 4-phosphate cytidylyltransferase